MMTCEQAKAGSDDSEEARECQRGRPVGVYSCRGGAGRESLHAECLSPAICAIRDTVRFVASRHLGGDFEIGSRHRQELIFIPARHIEGLAIGTDSNHVRTVPLTPRLIPAIRRRGIAVLLGHNGPKPIHHVNLSFVACLLCRRPSSYVRCHATRSISRLQSTQHKPTLIKPSRLPVAVPITKRFPDRRRRRLGPTMSAS